MLYAVNRKTKEHIPTNLSEWNAGNWPNSKYKIIDSDMDGWIDWHGGECPLPEGHHYQVLFAREDLNDNSRVETNPEYLEWEHKDGGGDVIAYRPIFKNMKSNGISRTPIMDSFRESQENKTSEWYGVEYPPVGYTVEAYNGCLWDEAEFLKYHNGAYAVFFIKSRALAWATDIRPVRSADERAIDEMSSDILDTVNRDGIDFCHDEKVIAKRLYAMGYRKVE